MVIVGGRVMSVDSDINTRSVYGGDPVGDPEWCLEVWREGQWVTIGGFATKSEAERFFLEHVSHRPSGDGHVC